MKLFRVAVAMNEAIARRATVIACDTSCSGTELASFHFH